MTLLFLFAFIFLLSFSPSIANSVLKTYIVHVKQRPEANLFAQSDSSDRDGWYKSFLPATATDSPQRMLHTYHNVISGFAARLTEDEVTTMKQKDGFILARLERVYHLQTTHTPNFLGLFAETGFWKDSNFGKGVIIGVLDTGILPSHPSFNDYGVPPPPTRWKGRCDFNVSSGCNNKVIGGRSFVRGSPPATRDADQSPVDIEGHGTHTASIAAGAFVKDAGALGNAYGNASGMAPYAHLAIYKVCSVADCLESDMLAGLDGAVEDGVDVVSMSIGSDFINFYEDSIAIGSFGAIQKGIFVSCSAGNSGPSYSTLVNQVPWILTVGASTIDRTIVSTAKLGNGEEYDGESLFQPKDFVSLLLPLIYAGANGNNDSAFCGEGSLNGTDVKGKVVLCQRGGNIGRILKGEEVKNAGGAAMILVNDEMNAFSTEADAHVLPATHVSFIDGLKIMAYINSSTSPMATITFKGTVIGKSSAPEVASFSSRGPSVVTPGILKPDIIGPGVSILAAWPFSLDNTTTTKSTFNVMSGTSMSCPHLSGIAAILKSSHPDWSPAAIKSAIMTTADVYNCEGKPIVDQTLCAADLFATGSGHVNPSRANRPGLVYDIHPEDYLAYLCGLNLTDDQIGIITRRTIKCANETSIAEGELNYPSFAVKLGSCQTFTRTVTNVGEAHSIYEVEILTPRGVDVSLQPKELHFTEMNQKLTYSVTFERITSSTLSQYSQGFLKWVSPKYVVRSPISVTFE